MADLFDNAPAEYDLREQLRCVNREIGMRRKVYPKWVAKGTMSAETAEKEMACMKAVRDTLMDLIAPKS